MKNNERVWLWGTIGFLLGIVGTVLVASNAVNKMDQGMMRMMGMNANNFRATSKDSHMMSGGEAMDNMMEHNKDESMSMEGMVDELKGKTGDKFDEEFIELMIEHHQGAIDMARLAKTNALHDEIKNLAGEIISAQASEIEMMIEWQKTWGY